ncbi:MAG: hypothetical protein JSS84_09490 [Bacteroidetes bacterium]|nr:hypothetical protein [Bacteroidota bacterium]
MPFTPELHVFGTMLPPKEAVEGKVAKWGELLAMVERMNGNAQANPYCFERPIPA